MSRFSCVALRRRNACVGQLFDCFCGVMEQEESAKGGKVCKCILFIKYCNSKLRNLFLAVDE